MNLGALLFHKLYPDSNFYLQHAERQRKFESVATDFLKELKSK